MGEASNILVVFWKIPEYLHDLPKLLIMISWKGRERDRHRNRGKGERKGGREEGREEGEGKEGEKKKISKKGKRETLTCAESR